MMSDELTLPLLFMIFAGVYTFYSSILALTGCTKAWYFGQPNYRFRSINTMGFGSAIFFFMTIWILVASEPLPTELSQQVFFYVYVGIPLLSFIFSIFEPPFVKPSWVKWLEQNHKVHIPRIKQEIERIGYRKWESMVDTDEKFQSWVEELVGFNR